MSDNYYVGNKSGGKDRYLVGWNENKQNANAYRVGVSSTNLSQASNASLGSGDQASPAGAKSAFSHKDVDTKDVGDRSPNMNLGGQVSNGIQQNKGAETAGNLEYTEKGDWSDKKNAMARRQANLDAGKKSGYMSPTVDLVSIKE